MGRRTEAYRSKPILGHIFCGTLEAQAFKGGEADLEKHFVHCRKNPGHKHYVPVDHLTINHLPAGYQDDTLLEFIKATADLTVRVDVRLTSPQRPKFWPDTLVPYAFYNMRGSDAMRIGTGSIYRVSTNVKGICKCRKCLHSDTPSTEWGHVDVDTTCHVVYDNIEAEHTGCRLFYDRQDSPCVHIRGATQVQSLVEADWCKLRFVTCDVDLLDKLYKMWKHKVKVWHQVIKRYNGSHDGRNLCFIVSHPHGCPKQVSIGHWVDKLTLDVKGSDAYGNTWQSTMYTYTAATCPGSSGAYVHLLADSIHLHSGVNSEGNNFSGSGGEWLPRNRVVAPCKPLSMDLNCGGSLTTLNNGPLKILKTTVRFVGS